MIGQTLNWKFYKLTGLARKKKAGVWSPRAFFYQKNNILASPLLLAI